MTVHRPPTGDHPDAFLEVVDALEQVAERRPVLFPVHPPTRVAVQEETTALGVPCFTLRANTERPITVTEGTTPLLEVRPPALARLLEALERSPLRRPANRRTGTAAACRVARVLVERYGPAGIARERLMVSGAGEGAR